MLVRIKGQRPTTARADRLLRGVEGLFFLLGIFALGYCVYVLLDARLYQDRQSQELEQAIEAPKPLAKASEAFPFVARGGPVEVSRSALAQPAASSIGSSLGRMEIEAIGVRVMVLEGADNRTLRRGVGHLPGSALPGQPGNAVFAGHRDTFFRSLRNVHRNDDIWFETLGGSYLYRVDLIEIVEPSDTAVLDSADKPVLTLVTCYPFSFLGPAPKRFIVQAHLVPGSRWEASREP
jgi:sortase A